MGKDSILRYFSRYEKAVASCCSSPNSFFSNKNGDKKKAVGEIKQDHPRLVNLAVCYISFRLLQTFPQKGYSTALGDMKHV
jgi:hypothetical protein